MVNGVVLYSNSVSLKAFSFKSCSLYWQPFRCQFALKPPSLSTAMQTSSATQGVRTLFNWICRFWSQLIRYDKNFRSFQKLKERNDFFGLVPKPTKWLMKSSWSKAVNLKHSKIWSFHYGCSSFSFRPSIIIIIAMIYVNFRE